MEVSEIQALKRELKSKIKTGDYITIAKMLGIAQDTARQRYRRNKEECVIAMKQLVDNREGFIKSYEANASGKVALSLPTGFAILDIIRTKSNRMLVAIITSDDYIHQVYKDADQMDAECSKLISHFLKNEKVTSIITDCSIGYLPEVVEVIKDNSVTHYFQHYYANRSEHTMQLLSNKY